FARIIRIWAGDVPAVKRCILGEKKLDLCLRRSLATGVHYNQFDVRKGLVSHGLTERKRLCTGVRSRGLRELADQVRRGERRKVPDSLETVHISKTPRNSFGAGFLNVDHHRV